MENNKNYKKTKIVKCRINEDLFDLFKKATKIKKTTAQNILEQTIKDFIIENLSQMTKEENKWEKQW